MKHLECQGWARWWQVRGVCEVKGNHSKEGTQPMLTTIYPSKPPHTNTHCSAQATSKSALLTSPHRKNRKISLNRPDTRNHKHANILCGAPCDFWGAGDAGEMLTKG